MLSGMRMVRWRVDTAAFGVRRGISALNTPFHVASLDQVKTTPTPLTTTTPPTSPNPSHLLLSVQSLNFHTSAPQLTEITHNELSSSLFAHSFHAKERLCSDMKLSATFKESPATGPCGRSGKGFGPRGYRLLSQMRNLPFDEAK